MKKMLFLAVVTALSIPTVAVADHAPMTGNSVGAVVNQAAPTGGYRNYGQCNSALMRERNARRQDPSLRPGNADLTNPEYNDLIQGRFECQQDANTGGWYVHRIDH